MKFQRLNTREEETTVCIMGKGLNSVMVATREIMVFFFKIPAICKNNKSYK